MFEHYTEHARRAIYFAKYEAAHAGSRSIDPEHLALGLLWDSYPLVRYLNSSAATLPGLREKLGVRSNRRKPLSMNDQIPLSMRSKKIIRETAVASDDLGQRHIGPEHLMLALLKVKKSLLDKIFPGGHADLNSLRNRIAKVPPPLTNAEAKGNSVTVASVLESLTAGVDDIFLPYLADELQFMGVNGNLHLGRNAFVGSKKDLLGPFSGKTVTFKLEDEEKKSPGIRICTLLWKEPNKVGKLDEEDLRLTALSSVGNDNFSVFLIQVALSAASPTKEGPGN
jgi:Clp amino terminal domain, pathogenicity island component